MADSLAKNSEAAEFTFSIEFPKAKLLPAVSSSSMDVTPFERGLQESGARWEAKLDDADKLDCTIAVASGIITGLIDSFFVGEFSLERANEWGSDKINGFVIAMSKLAGYEGGDLLGAIRYLEGYFKFATDGNTPDFGGGYQHHLRVLALRLGRIGLLDIHSVHGQGYRH